MSERTSVYTCRRQADEPPVSQATLLQQLHFLYQLVGRGCLFIEQYTGLAVNQNVRWTERSMWQKMLSSADWIAVSEVGWCLPVTVLGQSFPHPKFADRSSVGSSIGNPHGLFQFLQRCLCLLLAHLR